MNSKHRKTLKAIFSSPTPKNLEWARIESMFIAICCTVIDGAGSRVKFDYEGHTVAFHRPHPQKEAKPYMVRIERDFLEFLGVTP